MNEKSEKINTIPLQTIPYHSLKIEGSPLGSGSFGEVYKAKWFGTDVALKELHLKTLSPTLQAEFKQEAQMMAQCQFPHIVSLLGICDEVGHKGLVMEYMSKGSLGGVLEDKNKEISWDLRWTIALDIGKGLNYLHNKNILHRDLKSHNILLTADYHAKIGDFGLSKIKLETGSSTKSNKATGTTRWMAPELLDMDAPSSPTKASDVYSYGMVLWEISSREIPFNKAPNEMVATMWIANKKKESIPSDCPKAYGDIIKESWLAAENRPSAEEMVTHLSKAKPEPLLAIPEKTIKSYVEKSWHFDPMTERKAAMNKNQPYQLLEATEKDKQKVISFYQHHPVPGYEVGEVKVIYNRDFNQGFELHIKKLQQKHNNPGFTPNWDKENHAEWRAKTYNQLKDLAEPYKDMDYPDVKILPL